MQLLKKNVKKMFSIISLNLVFLLVPVWAAELAIQDKNASVDDEVVFDVLIGPCPNDVNALGFEITYDSTVLQYVGFDQAGGLADNLDNFSVGLVSAGLLRGGGYGAAGNRIQQNASGVLCKLTFKVLQYGNASLSLGNLKDDITAWTVQGGQFTSIDAYEDDDAYTLSKIIDKPQYRNFHDAGDVDWGWFYGEAGESYTIQALNLKSNSDVVLQLYDIDAQTILNSQNAGGYGIGESITWSCSVNGIYYIKTYQANSAIFGSDTDYTLKIVYPLGDAYEADDVVDSARVININGEPQRHCFKDQNDADWVKFYALPGIEYTIEAINLGISCDVILELIDSDGQTVLATKNDGAAGQKETILYTLAQEGVYFAKATFDPQSPKKRADFDSSMAFDIQVSSELICNEIPGSITGGIIQLSNPGIPVRNVNLFTNAPGESNTAQSLSNGLFLFKNHCSSSAPFTLTAKKKGYQTYSTTVAVDEGEAAEVNISMSCSGDVNGFGADITPKDALYAFWKYMEIEPPENDEMRGADICCDVTEDDDCSPADALCIFNKYLGIPSCLD